MRSLPGDLFYCMSFIIKGFSILYLDGIMLLQYVRTFIEFGLSLPDILPKRLDFVFRWDFF